MHDPWRCWREKLAPRIVREHGRKHRSVSLLIIQWTCWESSPDDFMCSKVKGGGRTLVFAKSILTSRSRDVPLISSPLITFEYQVGNVIGGGGQAREHILEMDQLHCKIEKMEMQMFPRETLCVLFGLHWQIANSGEIELCTRCIA
jgi:hypothetical protein